MKKLRKNLKGVSPVIATIIIVAIAIVMSIAVAYWMLGLGGSFTRYEKVEVTNAYAVVNTGGDFEVNMRLKNTGSATATIAAEDILFNGKPESGYAQAIGVDLDYQGASDTTVNDEITLEPGDDFDVLITLNDAEWQNGMTVEVTLHSVAGNDYPKVINLP